MRNWLLNLLKLFIVLHKSVLFSSFSSFNDTVCLKGEKSTASPVDLLWSYCRWGDRSMLFILVLQHSVVSNSLASKPVKVKMTLLEREEDINIRWNTHREGRESESERERQKKRKEVGRARRDGGRVWLHCSLVL